MRLAGVGDNVVDRYRELGLMFPGGQAVNVAVHARRLGVDAAYVGALGDDAAGRHVLGALRAEHVALDRVRVIHGPNAYGLVDLVDGNRVFVGGSKGVSEFRLDEADFAYLAAFDLVHSSESSFLESQIADIARVVPVSFDFSSYRGLDYIEPLLPHVAIAEFSLGHLEEGEAEDFAVRMQRLNHGLVLATRGEAGALLFDGTSFWRQPALPVEVVDTLGAGDALTARFLVGVLRREPYDVSLLAGAQVAAETCLIYGAFGYGTPSVPAVVPAGWVSAAYVPTLRR